MCCKRQRNEFVFPFVAKDAHWFGHPVVVIFVIMFIFLFAFHFYHGDFYLIYLYFLFMYLFVWLFSDADGWRNYGRDAGDCWLSYKKKLKRMPAHRSGKKRLPLVIHIEQTKRGIKRSSARSHTHTTHTDACANACASIECKHVLIHSAKELKNFWRFTFGIISMFICHFHLHASKRNGSRWRSPCVVWFSYYTKNNDCIYP